jgi:AraC-like DNA-binding protein
MLSKVPRIVTRVYDRRNVLIDQSFKIAKVPDVRLTDTVTRIVSRGGRFDETIEEPERAMLFNAVKGDFRLETENQTLQIVQGTAVGFQIGRKHRWIGTRPGADGFSLFVSSISRRAALLQGLDRDLIIIPPDAEPSASILRHVGAIHMMELARFAETGDDMILRRCAEIGLAELIRYARNTRQVGGDAPAGLAHDEQLLRAWSAYFADPRRRWTVAALAREAGLGRTAFALRFRRAVGVPPLTALTDLRMEQAVSLLRADKIPLIEIAFTVGYNSEAAFVRAFQRKYGLPPGRFRQAGKSA